MIQRLLCAFGLHLRVLEWGRLEGSYPLGWWSTTQDPVPRLIDGWGPHVLTGMHCSHCDWREAVNL